MFLGLRTLIVPAPDLEASKRWYAELLGREPYFDQPFYVGFNVGGYELGLDPNAPPETGPVTYWGVADADAGLAWLLEHGAKPSGGVTDVGDGIRVATAMAPDGLVVGIIENPHFEPSAEVGGEGPGR